MTIDKNYSDKYRRTYNALAVSYDLARFGSLTGHFSKQVKNEAIISLLAARNLISRDKTIIDVAAGTGRIAYELVKQSFSHVSIADISSEMLKKCAENIPPEFKKRVTFTLTDIKSLPFPAGSFDVATLGSFLYLIPHEEYGSYLADVFRILRPGGTLICEVSNAMCIANPVNALYVLHHKHWKRRRVKSYVYPWDIPKLFQDFELDDMVGVEYPLLTTKYDRYRKLSGFLGRFVPTKFFAGKFILVLRKKLHASHP